LRLIFHRKDAKEKSKSQISPQRHKDAKEKTKLIFVFSFQFFLSSLRLGVLAVNLSPQRRKGEKQISNITAKAQRRKGNNKTDFLIFPFNSFSLLCVLASLRLSFHRKDARRKMNHKN